ncbi:MAG: hypothetical protein U5J64_11440 [Halobacteriales archaeon]|nr:hypothetical protein [Halobacteriales archaeon]
MSVFENDRRRLEEEFDRALSGIQPEELKSRMESELSKASLTPALLCLLSARATSKEPNPREAAGIQMVHAGLDATRRILDSDSWVDAGIEPVEEDMVLLSADVLVTLGFEYLLDHYGAATRIVNRFGSEKARAVEATSFEERFEHESAHFVETYTTAVEIGCDGEPPEELVSLAESLAVADCLNLSTLDSEKRGVSASEEARRALSLAEHGAFSGYEAHFAAIRGESALGETCRAKGVEAQD